MTPVWLAAVVLSVRAQPGLVGAVESLLAQDPVPEIVVVDTGGGGAARLLRSRGLDVRVVDRAELLLPGGARNVGIAATTAPFVAFLAADCRALSGWAAARLGAHAGGAEIVAGSMAPPLEDGRAAIASHLLLHHRRTCETPVEERLLYSPSFSRPVLEALGPFREDLRGGEDTEYLDRARAAGMAIEWVPAAAIVHAHPTDLRALLRDQYTRGARAARAAEQFGQSNARTAVGAAALRRLPAAFRAASRASDPGVRVRLRAARVFLAPGAITYAMGAISGSRGPASRPPVGGPSRR